MRGDDLAGAAKLRVPLRVRRITMLPDFTKMLTDAGLPNMVAAVILFIIGLALLIKCGDWFVDGASGIAKKFRVPELLIGATVVSIGTTLPEVMVSATSAVKGHSQIAYGNAVGSIICNTALIAALTVAIKPSKVERKSFLTPVLFFFAAAAIYLGSAYTDHGFKRPVGIVLLGVFVAYMCVLVFQAVRATRDLKEVGADASKAEKPAEVSDEKTGKEPSVALLLILLIIGAIGIAVGADLLVNNGQIIAVGMGVPESVVALTFIALGTSLPELVTAITSLVKGHGALSLGNIVGANLFNLVLVSGLAITLRPFPLPADLKIGGQIASLIVDVPVSVVVMIILTIPTLIRGRLSRAQGIILLATYAAFCVYQFAGPSFL